jgi:hypothetical protein
MDELQTANKNTIIGNTMEREHYLEWLEECANNQTVAPQYRLAASWAFKLIKYGKSAPVDSGKEGEKPFAKFYEDDDFDACCRVAADIRTLIINDYPNSATGMIGSPVEALLCALDWIKKKKSLPLTRGLVSDEDVMLLRKELWLNHCAATHIGIIYGDDGEMQCSQCGLDFKRQPVKDILKRLEQVNLHRPPSTIE